MIPHCIVILMINPSVKQTAELDVDTHMFNMPAAEDVLPNNKNQGLKPSEDFFKYIRKC